MPKKHLVKLGDGEEYQGQLSNDVPHGFGRASFKSGCQYRGAWLNGQVRFAPLQTLPRR